MNKSHLAGHRIDGFVKLPECHCGTRHGTLDDLVKHMNEKHPEPGKKWVGLTAWVFNTSDARVRNMMDEYHIVRTVDDKPLKKNEDPLETLAKSMVNGI